MTENELQNYLKTNYPRENEKCEWKEFKSLKSAVSGRAGDDVNLTNNEELKAEYLANRSFDDSHFKDMIVGYLKKFGKSKRQSIDNLIIPKLSAALTEEKRKKKVTNFLSALGKEGKIKCTPGYYWELI
ncbi:hypothetical protein [Flavobacterium sp. ZB4R12]|uniref:hypothetical protein n=1 Tax=Flavobacterium sp. ZB4R12 TaxID=3398732 RepID=UPI003AADB041